MTPEAAKKLREPFPAALIGKLPKPTKADNPKGNCRECGGYHGLPAVHLDYVGHAAVCDRLLQVDPDWTWEPMAYGPAGEPMMSNGGMWIKLTICGVTRPGFGDGKNPKEIIGDAIRNAAMRFGVALDLWAKEDLHADAQGSAPSEGLTAGQQAGGGDPPAAAPAPDPPNPEAESLTRVLVGINPANEQAVAANRVKYAADPAKHVEWLKRQIDRAGQTT